MMAKERVLKESERRVVTILFADISGFTAMSEQLDAEEVTVIMNSCFTMMESIIEAHGGHVDKFIGDCVMALFGVPTAIEDGPCKAVNTAIELKNELYRLNEDRELMIPLDIHIGINTGEVVAGNIGSLKNQDYTVMGDAVNLASRLEHISTAGQIIVGPLTYRYLREEFKFKILKPIIVKGKKEPVPIFELLSKRQIRSRHINNRMIHSSLVDRERELGRLELAIMQVINERGGVINIIGEAGIGKSRLVREAKHNKFIRRVSLIEGQALSIGRNLSFHPLIDIFNKLASINEDDSKEDALFKLENFIRAIMQDRAREVLPFITAMMGFKWSDRYKRLFQKVDGTALSRLLLKSIREILIEATHLKPVVIILEDLHWADESSIELLLSLFRMVKEYPILFINLIRPGYNEATARLTKVTTELRDYISTIRLEALGKMESEQLTMNLLRKIKEVPGKVTKEIVRHSGGNPFFVEEVIRSLIDSRFIIMEKGNSLITENIVSATIPNSINEVIMSRIDRLDNRTRELLKVASVIGLTFFSKLLCCMVKEESEIKRSIDYLEKVQLITERVRMGEVEYIFKHAIARETIYNSILHRKRKELHLQVARTIESQFSKQNEELYGMLAYHYSRAEELDKTEEYLERAGKAALESSASSEALNYYKEALTLYKKKFGKKCDSDYLAHLERNIGTAYKNKGCYAEAVLHYGLALEYLGRKPIENAFLLRLNAALGLTVMAARLYLPSIPKKRKADEKALTINYLISRRSWSMAVIDSTTMCLETFSAISFLLHYDISTMEGMAAFLAEVAFVLTISGISFRLSLKLLQYIAPYTTEEKNIDFYTYKYSLSAVSFITGSWVEEYDENLSSYFLNQGRFALLSIYIAFHVVKLIEQARLDEADRLIEKMKKLARDFDNDAFLAVFYELSVVRSLVLRRANEALNFLEKLISLSVKIGEKSKLNLFIGMKAYAKLLIGQYEEAAEILNRLCKLEEKKPLPVYARFYLTARFLFYLQLLEQAQLEQDRGAIKCHRKAARKSGRLAIRNALRYAVQRPENYRLMGRYYWLIGRRKKAFNWWNKSIAEGERLGARIELARSYMELGKHIPGQKGEDYFTRAQEIFLKLNLSNDLNELEMIKRQRE